MSAVAARELGALITAAHTAHDLNAIAKRATRAELDDDERALLQAAFSRRCRALFPWIVR